MKYWSKQRKVVFYLLVLVISLFVCFSMSQWPSPTLEIAIRRMEKRMLVGPMEIIAELDFEYSSRDHLVIGKSEYGYSLYDYRDDLGWDVADLRYFPKAEDATIFCPEYDYNNNSAGTEFILPIFLFPENQISTDADLTLTISTPEASKTYRLEGQRTDSSFYTFSLPTEDLKSEFFWLIQQAITGAYSEYVLTGTVDLTVEFFDVSGNLIDTYTKSVTK